ncbi:MAG: hypothetical protein PHF63_04020 [Herbinix sp.]|nr:hypothetical protein [Herbinix sp.]
MNEKSIIMKNEIRAISKYRALILSKYYFNIILGFVTLYLGALRRPISSFYIFLFLNFLPPIFSFALKDYAQKYNNKIIRDIMLDNPFQLNNLKRKYNYSKMSYVANSASYFISIILICLWQINYSNTENINVFLNKLPIFILATGLILRFLAVIIYQIKLQYDLFNNKV